MYELAPGVLVPLYVNIIVGQSNFTCVMLSEAATIPLTKDLDNIQLQIAMLHYLITVKMM